MKKTIIRLFLWIGLLLSPVVVFAQQFNNEGMTYEVISEEQSTVMIRKAHRCVQHFDVPYKVKDYFGEFYWVKEIEYDAFRNLDCLYVLNLNGVEVLRDGYAKRYQDGAMDYFGTFANCRNLEEVVFGELRHLGDYAFYDCHKLSRVNLKFVEEIGKGAFQNCKSLEQIVLGRNVRQIGTSAFTGAQHISRIESWSEVPPVCAEGVFLDSVYQTAVLWVPAGRKAAYSQTVGWNNFHHVEELSTTGVEGVNHSVSEPLLTVKNGAIVVEGVGKGEWVRIYDAGGRPFLQRRSVGKPLYLDLPKGKMYWVEIGNKKCLGVRL